jgi:hypothetical protein
MLEGGSREQAAGSMKKTVESIKQREAASA